MPDARFQYFNNILLNDPVNGVERIISEIIDQENQYVEFKATAIMPADPSKIPAEANSICKRPDDYIWNIMKEIIAFANTSGGFIFVGIAEDKITHSLSTPVIEYKTSNGECKTVKKREDWDEYKLVVDGILREKKTYKPTNPDHPDATIKYSFEESSSISIRIINQVKLDVYRYKDGFVLGIIVEAGKDNDYFFVTKETKIGVIKETKSGFFIRRSGSVLWLDDSYKIHNYKRPDSMYTTGPILRRIPSPSIPFVGRVQELLDLHKFLSPYRKGKHIIPVLTGPDSIGKHTLACKYCEQYWIEYDTVINASNLKCARDIYLELAGDKELLTCFGVVFDEHDDDEKIIKKIKHALFDKAHGHILILLEEIQKPSDIFYDEAFPELFPESGEDYVHILATSSSKLDWNPGENERVIPFPVRGLTDEEGLELLRQWRKFEPGTAEEKAAAEIVKILNGHTGLLVGVGRELKLRRPPYDDDYREKLKLLKNDLHKTLQKQMENIYAPIIGNLDKNQRMILYAASLCPDGWIREDVFYKAFVSFTGTALDRRDWDELFIALPDHYLLRNAQGTKNIYSIDDSILRKHFKEEVANDNDAKKLFGKYVEQCLDEASEAERLYFIDFFVNGLGKTLFKPMEIAEIFLAKPHHRFFLNCFWSGERQSSYDMGKRFEKRFDLSFKTSFPPHFLFLQQTKPEYSHIPLYAFMLEFLFNEKTSSNSLVSFLVDFKYLLDTLSSSEDRAVKIYESNLYDIGLIIVRTSVFVFVNMQYLSRHSDKTMKEDISSALEKKLWDRSDYLSDSEMAYYCNEFGKLYGNLSFELRDYERALKCQLKALEYALKSKDVDSSALFVYYNNAGCAYLVTGDKANAKEHFSKALEISSKTQEKTKDKKPLILVNLNLGVLTVESDHDEVSVRKALSYFNAAEEYSDDRPSDNLISILYNKARCYSLLHNAEAVIENCQKALDCFAITNSDPKVVRDLYRLMFQANEFLHHYDESLDWRFKLLDLVKSDPHPEKNRELAIQYGGIGLVYLEFLNDEKKAIEYFEKALDIYQTVYSGLIEDEDKQACEESILFYKKQIQECKDSFPRGEKK